MNRELVEFEVQLRFAANYEFAAGNVAGLGEINSGILLADEFPVNIQGDGLAVIAHY
ncbi:MAG: hypothetical protein WC637_09505 [Victivallales bacterium]